MPFPDKYNRTAYRQACNARAQEAAELIRRCGEAKDFAALARIVVDELEKLFDNGTAHPIVSVPFPEHLRHDTSANRPDEPDAHGDVTSDQFVEIQLARAIWPLLMRQYVASVMVHIDHMGTSVSVRLVMDL